MTVAMAAESDVELDERKSYWVAVRSVEAARTVFVEGMAMSRNGFDDAGYIWGRVENLAIKGRQGTNSLLCVYTNHFRCPMFVLSSQTQR